MEKIVLMRLMLLTKIFEWKLNLLVNYKVIIHQRLECFPVHQKMPPLKFWSNVYTFSLIVTVKMDSKVEIHFKIDNYYLNINHIYKF